jgi:hypothetical protein
VYQLFLPYAWFVFLYAASQALNKRYGRLVSGDGAGDDCTTGDVVILQLASMQVFEKYRRAGPLEHQAPGRAGWTPELMRAASPGVHYS